MTRAAQLAGAVVTILVVGGGALMHLESRLTRIEDNYNQQAAIIVKLADTVNRQSEIIGKLQDAEAIREHRLLGPTRPVR